MMKSPKKKTCLICGTEFSNARTSGNKNIIIRHKSSRTCSKKCSKIFVNNRQQILNEVKNCVICYREFAYRRLPGDTKTIKRQKGSVTCSVRCGAKHNVYKRKKNG